MSSNTSINCTVDKNTHKIWKNVARKQGISMKNVFRNLVILKALDLNIKVPKALVNAVFKEEDY